MPWHKMSRHMIVESVWHTVGINSVQLLEIQDCFGCLITQFSNMWAANENTEQNDANWTLMMEQQ